MPERRLLAPLLYAVLGLLLLAAANSRVFVREDALQVPNHCGRLSAAPASELLLTRAVGEDGAYYRPLANLFLGALARTTGCEDARPYRAAAGLLWLLCAASLAWALLSAGASPLAAWGAAALLMAHPYNSWFFVSPLLATGALLLPATVGAWRSYRAAEDGRGVAGALGAAACVYLACLARENAVLLPLGLAVAAFFFRPRLTRASAAALAAAFAASGLYLLQRRWVLAHDLAAHPPLWQWERLPEAAVAATEYLRLLLTGSYRAYGAMLSSDGAPLHVAAWTAAAAVAAFFAPRRRESLGWAALLLLCASEIAVSALLNGEVLPVRATATFAFVFFLLALKLAPKRATALALVGIGVFWSARSWRHVRASADPDGFLELHSNPPYSWKIEGERAASWLRRGDVPRAYEAARASERLRPSWLTSALRASLEAIHIAPGRLDELRALAASGRGEPGAQFGYVNLGVAFGRNGAWAEADACLATATELAPGYGAAWSQRAWSAVSQGRWADGVTLASRALELAPNDADSRHNLAFALSQLTALKPREPLR